MACDSSGEPTDPAGEVATAEAEDDLVSSMHSYGSHDVLFKQQRSFAVALPCSQCRDVQCC